MNRPSMPASAALHRTFSPTPIVPVRAIAGSRLSNALKRTGNDDRQALNEVYALTSAKLFNICLRVCGNQQAAEDVLHDVYLTIWKRARAWDPARGTAIGWLATIARNRAIDWKRAAKRLPMIVPIDEAFFVADPSLDAETMLLLAESTRQVHHCLSTLDARHRDAVYAAFFNGETYAELAKKYGVPLGTMKGWIRRSLAKMNTELQRLDAQVPSVSH